MEKAARLWEIGKNRKKQRHYALSLLERTKKTILKVWLHFFRPTVVPIVQYIIYHYLIVN